VIDGSEERISLENFIALYTTKNKNLSPQDINPQDWMKSKKGSQFGVVNKIYWFKYEIENTSKTPVKYHFYMPYHHVAELVFYQKIKNNYTIIERTGTTTSYRRKQRAIAGYSVNIEFPVGKSSIIVKANHINMPLRVGSFLVKESELNMLTQKNNSLKFVWYIVLIISFFASVLFFIFTKQKIFLYYLLMNFGILVFIGIEIGGFFLFFDIDLSYYIIDIKHWSILFVLYFFPRFLDSLTPIKKNSEIMWKTINYAMGAYFILWLVNLHNPVKFSSFGFYSVNILILISVYMFFLQMYFLIKAAIYKEKNSRILVFIYFFYIGAVVLDVVLPNIGFRTDNIHVYRELLYSSMVEVIVFMLLMGVEIYRIYKDRNELLETQKEHQKTIIKAIVKSQEKERNEIGRDLHDMISGNINVIKQNIDSSDSELVKLIDSTIESVRNMSHGLVTPKVKGVDFKNEIIDLCLLSSNSKMIVEYYFHDMEEIKNEEISTHLYRIIQELLQNAMKHSNASKVYIQFLKEKNSLFVSYEDNGKGVKLTPEIMNKYGLVGIKNRISLIDGKIDFESSEGNGFYVHIDVKLD